eukprot:gene7636-10395_t
MPASGKMLKSRQQAANRAAGIGDEQGRLPSRVKAAEVLAKCTVCSQELRMTKKNVEAQAHAESKHPTFTFAACWPGQFDPTVVDTSSSMIVDDTTTSAAPVVVAPPKKKPAADLSFLDAALDSKAYSGNTKKK